MEHTVLLLFLHNISPFQYVSNDTKIAQRIKETVVICGIRIIYTIVFLALNVIQLCVLRMGIKSLFQSAIIANILGLLAIFILEPKLKLNIFCKIDRDLVFELYRYSVPLVPNYLNWWVINSSDRYIVLYVLGSSYNGILAIAHKFPSMLQAVLALFNSSWQDYSVADINGNSSEYYTTIFERLYIFSFTCLLALIPATKIITVLLMSYDYKEACDYVAFYYLGTVFQSFSSFYGVGYLRSGNTKKSFSTSVYGAIVNATVNICFIKFIGLQAAAVSTFIGFLIMWLIREKQNRKELGICIKWYKFWGLTILSVAMCVFSIMTCTYFNVLLFVIGTVISLLANRVIVKETLGKVILRLKRNTK